MYKCGWAVVRYKDYTPTEYEYNLLWLVVTCELIKRRRADGT